MMKKIKSIIENIKHEMYLIFKQTVIDIVDILIKPI